MTGKRSNLLEDPPTASSSDEDEVETSVGEGDEIAGNSSSDEEEDSSKNRSVKKKPEASLAATTEKQVSDSETGSDEETDSDSETEKKDPVKKNPVSSVVKPIIESKDSSVKNQDSKKVKTSEKSTAKRPRETDGGASTDVKRVKRVSGEEEKKSGGEETKKTYFQRLWSEDDEIAVLQGLIDYKTETGVSPYDDTTGFYQLVKKSISFDVSKIQFMEKLRSLKKKYENNVGKAKNGEEPTFSKSHDRKAFDLSKNVWGVNGMALESAVKSNGKSKKSSKSKKVESVKQDCEDEVTNKGDTSSLEMDVFLKSVLVKSLARLGVDDLAAQQGWSKLASEDKKRFEDQWKALQLREFEFYSQKSGFVHEVVTKMAEAFRSNP
ncbi:putative transcription factor [Cardamine amara subsp. amara]|uniref:Transcription factor n=1 Tax=Cardamine amara subsp. amara TaxID=228776 RepID=A0ABD0Z1R1_CARAN